MIINWGDAPFKAFITVTYPSGTCKVTNGTDTFTHSGGGTTTFTLKKKGTWTVKATHSAGYVSEKTVVLSKFNQSVSVELLYKTILFETGNEHTEITGGWNPRAWMYNNSYGEYTATPVETHSSSGVKLSIKAAHSGGHTGVWEVKKDIDLTNIKTVRVHALSASLGGTYSGLRLAVGKRSNTYASEYAANVAILVGTSAKNYDVDVSGLSGTYDVYIMLRCSDSATTTVSLDEVAMLA